MDSNKSPIGRQNQNRLSLNTDSDIYWVPYVHMSMAYVFFYSGNQVQKRSPHTRQFKKCLGIPLKRDARW